MHHETLKEGVQQAKVALEQFPDKKGYDKGALILFGQDEPTIIYIKDVARLNRFIAKDYVPDAIHSIHDNGLSIGGDPFALFEGAEGAVLLPCYTAK